jgi:hypothetical protein
MELLGALMGHQSSTSGEMWSVPNRFIEQSQPELISAHVTVVIESIENCFCVVLYLLVAREDSPIRV